MFVEGKGAIPEPPGADRIQANLKTLDLEGLQWDKPKTYYASPVHDCFYQISGCGGNRLTGRKVDAYFLALLRAWRFSAARFT